jgi:peptidoglycan hydrolase CwlO-like protein
LDFLTFALQDFLLRNQGVSLRTILQTSWNNDTCHANITAQQNEIRTLQNQVQQLNANMSMLQATVQQLQAKMMSLEAGVTSLLQRVPIVELTYNGIGESIGT